MGTRGFVGFVADGTEKIAYNHFDSYPEGLGKDVLTWLTGVVAVEAGIETLTETARQLRVVDPRGEPTDEDIGGLRQYQLLRETQGDPQAMLAAGVVEDAHDFPLDSLFAEWGYVVDLDAGVFEAYKGFQHEAHGEGRFAGRTPSSGRVATGYHPCRLVATWPLSALPTPEDFVRQLEPSDEEDES
jgi:hypothetical protein